jgi:hypothetical protein
LKDRSWWAKTRPIELTADEQAAYQKRKAEKRNIDKDRKSTPDSLAANLSSKPTGLDTKFFESLTTNQFTLSKTLVLKGNIFTFNIIEGGVFKPNFIVKAMPNQKEFITDVSLRYGFASNTFYGKTSLSYELNPKHLTKIQVEGGRYVEEISGNESISDFWNMTYSLFEQNFIKFYQKNFANIVFQTELANGLDASISTRYAIRSPLQNNSSYNWAKKLIIIIPLIKSW